MDALTSFLAIVGSAAGIYLVSVAVGTRIDRWGHDAGIEPSRGARRISTRRLAAGMACVIFAPALGAFVATIHLVLLALTVPIALVGLVAGIRIMHSGEEVEPPPRREQSATRHAGFAYFRRCWLPLMLHGHTRAMLSALTAPLFVLGFVVLERWLAAAIAAGVTALFWVLVLFVAKPRSVPRHGLCARAE